MHIAKTSHLLMGLLLAVTRSAFADTVFTVDSTADLPDVSAGDGVCRTSAGTCTLRAAIMQANVADSGTTIVLPAGHYTLTIPPSGSGGADNGDLDFTPANDVQVIGAGRATTVIDANHIDRVVRVQSGGGVVALQSLTLENGMRTDDDGGCLYNAAGVVQLVDVVVTDCTTSQNGGAIMNESVLQIDRGVIRNASANADGGGIVNRTLMVAVDTTIESNIAVHGGGGGLATTMNSNTTLQRSTIAYNQATQGGGLYADGLFDMEVSTIFGNAATTFGGGIYDGHNGVLAMSVATIAFNAADSDGDGSGFAAGIFIENGAAYVSDSLIAGNFMPASRSPDDCDGALVTENDNRIGSQPYCDEKGCQPTGFEGCAVVAGSDPSQLLNDTNLLGTLGDNGGPTPTVALLPGSNAIDAVTSTAGCQGTGFPPPQLNTDQRGYPRAVNNPCDVGAYEFGATNPQDFLFADGFD